MLVVTVMTFRVRGSIDNLRVFFQPIKLGVLGKKEGRERGKEKRET